MWGSRAAEVCDPGSCRCLRNGREGASPRNSCVSGGPNNVLILFGYLRLGKLNVPNCWTPLSSFKVICTGTSPRRSRADCIFFPSVMNE